MTRVLLLLSNVPEPVREQYRRGLLQAFPDIVVDLVDHHSKVGPTLAETEVLITFGPMLADHVVADAPKLKWLQALGTGVDNIVDLPSLRPEVTVTNVVGIHGAPVSEAALSAMLCLSREVPTILRNQDRGVWARLPARLLDGKTVGIFGVGLIAEALAPKCQALGMRVIGMSSVPRDVAGFDRVVSSKPLAAAVGELDYFVLLTPYSAATRHAVDAGVLAAMKPSAYLINLARGGVVDEAALLAALQQRRIAGASLDVFAVEPLPAGHPFWTLPNVIVTPHVAGFCDVYAERALPVILDNMRRFRAGDFAGMVNRVAR